MARQGTGAVVLVCVLGLASTVSLAPAAGPEPDESGTWLSAVRVAAEQVGAAVPGAAEVGGWQKLCPVTVSVDYTLATDYIWRGVNNSEYRGEGREKLNHQLGIGFSYDTGTFGTFGGLIWLEWYAGQEGLTANSNDHLQEVDYVAYWSYKIEPIATTFEAGWIGYQYPQLSGGEGCTNEWYTALRFDDARLFGTKSNVLNPYVAFYMDVDDYKRGCWMELGVSHDVPLAAFECCRDAAVLKDLTITPSFVLGYDHRYLDKLFRTGAGSSKVAALQYGLDVTYDLAGALGLSQRWGELTVTGFLRFSDAVRDDRLDDEFWGGVTFAWKW